MLRALLLKRMASHQYLLCESRGLNKLPLLPPLSALSLGQRKRWLVVGAGVQESGRRTTRVGLYAARCVRHAADVYQPREPTRGLAWEQAARTEKLAALHALEAELQAAQADAAQYADNDPKKLEAVRTLPPPSCLRQDGTCMRTAPLRLGGVMPKHVYASRLASLTAPLLLQPSCVCGAGGTGWDDCRAHNGPWVRCGEEFRQKASLLIRIIPSTSLYRLRAASQWRPAVRLSAGEATGIAKAAANRWLGARHPTGLRAQVRVSPGLCGTS